MIYPKEVILEVTNFCNIRCRYCHFHGVGVEKRRALGHMQSSIWRKVVQEIGEWGTPVTLLTHGAGEPLLYKELEELLIFTKKFKNIYLGFMSNGMLFTPEWSDKVLSIGIDWIAFSVDGTDPEKHSYFRQHTDLNKIEKNIDYLIKKRESLNSQKPYITMNMVVYPDMESEKDNYLKRWLPKVNKVIFSKFRPIGSKILGLSGIEPSPCPHLFNQFVISFDGKVGLCCEDNNLDECMGDVGKESIVTIFNNDKFNNFRELHQKKLVNKIKLCSNCDIWGGGVILTKNITDNICYEKTPSCESYHKI